VVVAEANRINMRASVSSHAREQGGLFCLWHWFEGALGTDTRDVDGIMWAKRTTFFSSFSTWGPGKASAGQVSQLSFFSFP